MALGIFPKAQRALDLAAGLATGVYRAPMKGAPRNTNTHHVLGQAEATARVTAASNEAVPAMHYAALFWAQRFLKGIESPHICDFGGGFGEACVRFGRFFPKARFTVVEIPELVAIARQIGAVKHVYFTGSAPESCDLLFSNGCTTNAHKEQFACVEKMKPPALIITGVEITNGDTFWSMQVNRRFGRRCPYITFNERDFVQHISVLGYTLKDRWTMGPAMSGPFLDGRTQPEYRGYAFSR